MPTFRPWTPYVPPMPPAGSYDPALDAQRYAAARGLLDLTQDIDTANTRDRVDYGLARDDIQRGRTRGLEDIDTQRQALERGYGRSVFDANRSYDRGAADLQTARSRADEDYQRSLQMLQRSYQQLAARQQQQMNAAGVLRGGAALQAARKRAENEALDRQPLDTSHGRFVQDNTLALSRLGEDRDLTLSRLGEDRQVGLDALTRSTSRLNEDSDLALGRLALQSAPPDESNPFGGRVWQDRTTQLARAQRDYAAFGLDLASQQAYQAAGAGWAPPLRGEPGGPPSNEFTTPAGDPYRVIVRGGYAYGVDPSGRELWRRRRAG